MTALRWPAAIAAAFLLIQFSPALARADDSGQPPAAAPASGTEAVVAIVDGEPITRAELAAAGGASLARLREQLYAQERQRLEQLISERLLALEAQRRGVTVGALLEAEVISRSEIGESEAKAWIEAHAEQFRSRETAEARLERARAQARFERQKALREALLTELRARVRIVSLLVPPEPYRAPVPVSAEGGRVRGPAGAPVTIVEFSDFHCPHCRRAQDVLEQLRAKYGDKLRLVYRDFPLDRLHPQARRAAEAARCAGDQGRFWEFHDALFRSDPDASDAALLRLAGEKGLERAAFQSCLASGRHAAEVKADEEAGRAVGVATTPSFFVNGRALHGAQPIEEFSRLVDDELARATGAGR